MAEGNPFADLLERPAPATARPSAPAAQVANPFADLIGVKPAPAAAAAPAAPAAPAAAPANPFADLAAPAAPPAPAVPEPAGPPAPAPRPDPYAPWGGSGPIVKHDPIGPVIDWLGQFDWLSPPKARPSAISSVPVGGTIPTPNMSGIPSAAPATRTPTEITSQPVGSTLVNPAPYATAQVKSGVESVAQTPYAIGTQMIVRNRDVLDRIDRGDFVPPAEDPLGYGAMTPAQRVQARADLDQVLSGNVGRIVSGQQYQESLPQDPATEPFRQAKGWGQASQAFANAPAAVLQDFILRSLPAMTAQMAPSLAGGPLGGVAGFLGGLATMGPPQFAQELVKTMQVEGVDVNDPQARDAWVANNGETIKSLYDRSMNIAAITTGLQVAPFHAAQYLPFQGTVARGATGAGLGVATSAPAPYIGEALGGPEATPQDVLGSVVLGGPMGLAGGVGSRAEPRPFPLPRSRPAVPEPHTVPELVTVPEPPREIPPPSPPEAVPPSGATATAGDTAPPRPGPQPETPPAGTSAVRQQPTPVPPGETVVPAPSEPGAHVVSQPRVETAPAPEPPRPVEVQPPDANPPETRPAPPPQPETSEVPAAKPANADAGAAAAEEPPPPPPPTPPSEPTPSGEANKAAPSSPEAPLRQPGSSSPEAGAAGAAEPAAREPVTTASGKRPVSTDELAALDKRLVETRKALSKAERAPARAGLDVDKARQAFEKALEAREAAEGPPAKPSYQPGHAPPAGTHEADAAAHADLVARRVHAEGGEHVPEPAKAGRALSMGSNIVEGRDSSGQRWAGTGHVMVWAGNLGHEITQALKKKTTPPPKGVDASAIDRVTQPQKGATYEPLTAERQVTPPGQRESVVFRTPSGHRIVVDKAVVDALHKAAGRDGQLVHDTRDPGAKGTDTRVLAKNVSGETVGVGMPRRTDQREAGIYATGEAPARETSEPKAATPAPKRERAPRKTQDVFETTETPVEAARREAAQEGLPPKFSEEARTDRASHFNQAFSEAGHDPAKAVNYPPHKQLAILSKHLSDKYGFKSVLGSPRDQRRAIDNMLDANRNLQTMAHVLGIRPQDISLGGRLSLNMVPRNSKYFGSYDPRTRSINMADRSNSFAHEWIHALDHMLVEHLRRGGSIQDLATRQVMGSGFNAAANLNTDTTHAFSRILNSMFTGHEDLAVRMLELHQQMDRYGTGPLPPELIQQRQELQNLIQASPSEYFKNAIRMDQGKGYFATPWEMLARSGEAYVADRVNRLMDPTKTTEFISKTDRGYLSDADARFANTFPKRDERALQFDAWQELFDSLRRDQIVGDGRPGSARPTTLPGNFDIIDPRRWDTANVPLEQRGVAGALRAVASGIADDARLIGRGIVEPKQLGSDMLRRIGIDTSKGEGLGAQAVRGTKDLLKASTLSLGGRFGVVNAKYKGNARAQAIISQVRDMFDPQLGKRRLITDTYGSAVNREVKQRMSKIGAIMKAHGLENMTQAQKDALRDTLTGHAKGGAPREITQAAQAIREQLNDLWYYANSKGVDVGYAANSYFPRVLVDHLVFDDAPKFVRQAKKVYADQWDERLAKEDPEAHKALMRTMLTEVDEHPSLAADPEAARDAYAQAKAEDWNTRLRKGSKDNFNTLGPDAGFTNERVLPASADTHMRDFYVRDPVDALHQHVRQAVSRSEYVGRVGRSAEKLDEMMGAAEKAGVHPNDIAEIRHLVELTTGRNRTQMTRPLQKGLDWMYALGTIGLMPRAVYASLAEPAMTVARTRDFGASVGAFKALLGDVFKGKDTIRRQEIAHAIGAVTHSSFDTIMSDRMVSGMHDAGAPAQMLSNFFERTGLTGLTNYQRVSMVAPAEVYVKHMLERSQGTGSGAEAAKGQLRELGIADQHQSTIHEWAQKFDDWRAEDLTGSREGRMVGEAVRRTVDQIILEPTRIDKPEMAQNPFGRFLFGLMSFNYANTRNFHMRMVNETKASGSFGAGVGTAASFIPGIAALYAANLAVSLVRDQLFGTTNANTKPEDELQRALVSRPLSRAGFAGAFDPIVQAFTGLKYQRSLTGVAAGAQMGFFLNAMENILKPYLGENSPNTNTAERNQVKGVMSLAAVPISLAMTALPGGWPSMFGGQWITSPQGQEFMARLVAGEQHVRGGGGNAPSRPARAERPERPSRPSR